MHTCVLYLKYVCISGVGLRETIHRKLANGGVTVADSGDLAGRMASYVLSSKAENTNKKYFAYFNRFKLLCNSKESI